MIDKDQYRIILENQIDFLQDKLFQTYKQVDFFKSIIPKYYNIQTTHHISGKKSVFAVNNSYNVKHIASIKDYIELYRHFPSDEENLTSITINRNKGTRRYWGIKIAKLATSLEETKWRMVMLYFRHSPYLKYNDEQEWTSYPKMIDDVNNYIALKER